MKIHTLKTAAILFLSYCNVLLAAPVIENHEDYGVDNAKFETNDSQGYIIDSLFTDNSKDRVGLFSSTDGAKISNVIMTNIEIYCKEIGGSIVGLNSFSIIKNCYSNGVIKSFFTK